MKYEQYLKNLEVPKGKIDVVLDTDAYNEIDDQFAIAYMLENSWKLNVKAIYAAPFLNMNSSSPEDGMEKSYDEIIKVLKLSGRQDMISCVLRGAKSFLSSIDKPQMSDAAYDICKRAMMYSPENPLYVVSAGAITNVASALLINPEIAENIVIVWMGGNEHGYPDSKEFNMIKDICAAQIVFESHAPLIQLPLRNTLMNFTLSQFEAEYLLRGKNALCDYLVQRFFTDHNIFDENNTLKKPITRILCDVCAIAWLLNDDNQFMESHLISKPIIQNNGYYSFDKRRELMSCIHQIKRDVLMCDLFDKITRKLL